MSAAPAQAWDRCVPRAARRVGIFGGGFDPIHEGHLHAARAARDVLQLDAVLLVPTGVPPHKAGGHRASSGQRCEMARIAVAAEPGLAVSDIEACAQTPSYTVDTVRALADLHPQVTDWFFILGDDCAANLHRWKGLEELLRRVRFVNVRRHGRCPDEALRASVDTLDVPAFPAASSDIRRALAAGEWSGLPLAPGVLAYIRRHGLYGRDQT